jgi:hypothetical protein
LAATYRIDGKWFLNAYADAGGLSNSATGQGLAEVGYNWTSSIATTLGYRVLYLYDKQNNAGMGVSAFRAGFTDPPPVSGTASEARPFDAHRTGVRFDAQSGCDRRA